MNAERERLAAAKEGKAPWRRFGPYLAERQWGTVREDYSRDGSAWDYFPFEMAASRAIKEVITQLIAAESAKRPFSDQKIADKLRDKGIQIARRTVAKYREQLKILPARLRKEVKTTQTAQGT